MQHISLDYDPSGESDKVVKNMNCIKEKKRFIIITVQIIYATKADFL